ncbi:MAG: RloB family protein [Bacilli bacterium]|nr:RloB family protein [Bacilli bacterium]
MGIKNRGYPSRRSSKGIPIGRNVLFIYCGEQTEKNYFQHYLRSIKDRWAAKNHQITQFRWEDKALPVDPMNMAKKVEKIIKDQEHISDIFVVFDLDSFPHDNFDNTVTKLLHLSDEDKRVWPLWSNECIELWFLLHFEFYNVNSGRNQYFDKLGKHLGSHYEKNDEKIAQKILAAGGRLEDAVKFAKKLHDCYDEGTPYSKRCPDTAVDDFFKEFQDYINAQ